jgi:AraC-like DNA-binding protein
MKLGLSTWVIAGDDVPGGWLSSGPRPVFAADIDCGTSVVLDAVGLEERVRALLATERGFGTLEQVAARLDVPTSTLKLGLAACGLTFWRLLDRARRDRALFLLRSTSLKVDAVAYELGYSSLPNFIRAFRRWTGCTPAAYRRAGVQRAFLPGARAGAL